MLDNDISVFMKHGKKVPFSPREGQCASVIDGKMYVFGGVSHTNDDEPIECNELLVYDGEIDKWAKVDSLGDKPMSRVGATMSAVGSKLYLFGGLNNDHGWLNDVNLFDSVLNKWETIEVKGKGPCPRDKLCSTVIGEKIYLFGGFGPQSLEEELTEEEIDTEDEDIPEEADQNAAHFGWFNDIFVFDTVSCCWTNPMQMNLGVPTARAASSMCSYGKKIIIFGGRDSEARRNDVNIFDTETRKWQTFDVSGKKPATRSFHTCSVVGNRMVIIGGRASDNTHVNVIDIFDLDTYQWMQPEISGDEFKGRGQHSAALVNDKIVIYGGSSDFDAETNQCRKICDDYYYIKCNDIENGGVIQTDDDKENVDR